MPQHEATRWRSGMPEGLPKLSHEVDGAVMAAKKHVYFRASA